MKISVVACLGLAATTLTCVEGAGLRTHQAQAQGQAAPLPMPSQGGIVKEDKMFWERLLQGSGGDNGPINEFFDEDTNTQTVSQKVDDPLTLVLISGNDVGITIRPDGTITVDTNVYELSVGENEIISYTQTVDGQELAVVVTVRGVNDDPVAQPLVLVQPEQSGPYTLDVLLDATDVDDPNDSLTIQTVTLIDGDGKGVSVPTDSGKFGLDTDVFDLDAGERVTSVYDVVITDPNDGTTEITVTLVVVGDNLFKEDDGIQCTDLPDGVTGIKETDSPGLDIRNDRLCIDTDNPAYELPEDETITTTTEVCLNEACDETETVVIVVIGVNDPPIADPIVEQYFEQTGSKLIELLRTVTDPDTPLDELEITNISPLQGDDRGFTIDETTNQLTVNTELYENLDEFETAVVTFIVTVSDGKATVNVPVQVTIVGTDGGEPFTELEDEGTVCVPDTDVQSIIGDAPKGVTIGTGANAGQVCINTDLYELPKDDEETVPVRVCLDTDVPCTATDLVTIVITGVDDPPTAGPITKTYEENSGPQTFSALEDAQDPDGTPTVLQSTLVSGDASGISPGNTFVVQTNEYDLLDGEIETIIYTVDIGDALDQVPITVTINIVGVSGEPFLQTVNEDDGIVPIEDLPDSVVKIIIPFDPQEGVSPDVPVEIDTDKYELAVDETLQIPVTLCLDQDCINTELLLITVIGVNDPPVAQPLSIEVPERTGGYPLNVLLRATDVDNVDST
eukprot:scaffold422774_cov43-Attheya_sp.AAC.1